MGLRAVAVAVYRVITSKKPVLIVKNEERSKSLKTLIKSVTDRVSTTLFGPEEKREGEGFTVTTEGDYKNDWKQFAGKEICMVEKETPVKNPGVDLMEETLENALGALAVRPTDRISRTVGRVVTSAEQLKARFELAKERGVPVKKAEVKQILKTTLRAKVERELLKHVLMIWGIDLDKK
ncbi:MAG: hypothetical protein GWO20_17365 [Candidatus Korarchaeota archaeon]|nr:hypothetical protein [Candidatus Korarchaeota archaeon]NIU81997.1 hypothetical protein [Candidatus Thorarchaeota archaeon]NIW15164.1 hypothetical protein [Candidatus Thorarchaeota archaeon]NIW53154.1 hypothetical protein [Candidatus Korarchaeota archaeon]